MEKLNYTALMEKWAPVLDEETAGSITDIHRKRVTAAVLENQERDINEQRAQMTQLTETVAANNTGSVSNWDPVLISLVRRSMPNLIAYDVCGVQPMTGPTGLVFSMRSRYKSGYAGQTDSTEALFDEAVTGYSGDSGAQSAGTSGLEGAIDSDNDSTLDEGVPTFGTGMTTAEAEALGTGGGSGDFREMGFTIDKSTVTAVSRALKAEYTIELAQDLKAIHGLDADTELANILSVEILAEINREVIRTINSQAKLGAQQGNVQTRGAFNLSTDADGRWSVEKFQGLYVQLDRECNVIAKETRRGKGNVVICSSDVATAFNAAKMLNTNSAITAGLEVDDTGNTFAGLLNGRTRVYIDPYATGDYITVGFRGSNPFDAGVFYCPYVPLQMMRAVGENDFQPRIGFKTRYGMISNPFVGDTPANGLAANRTNQYYRIFRVDGILA